MYASVSTSVRGRGREGERVGERRKRGRERESWQKTGSYNTNIPLFPLLLPAPFSIQAPHLLVPLEDTQTLFPSQNSLTTMGITYPPVPTALTFLLHMAAGPHCSSSYQLCGQSAFCKCHSAITGRCVEHLIFRGADGFTTSCPYHVS